MIGISIVFLMMLGYVRAQFIQSTESLPVVNSDAIMNRDDGFDCSTRSEDENCTQECSESCKGVQQRIRNCGRGPGDGTGNKGHGPRDGTGYGAGSCRHDR